MTTRVNAKQLETPVGNAKLVTLGRVSAAAHLLDEKSPVQHPAAFSEAQQDHGIDLDGDEIARPDSRLAALLRQTFLRDGHAHG